MDCLRIDPNDIVVDILELEDVFPGRLGLPNPSKSSHDFHLGNWLELRIYFHSVHFSNEASQKSPCKKTDELSLVLDIDENPCCLHTLPLTLPNGI